MSIKALREALAAGPTALPWELFSPESRYPGIEGITRPARSIVIYGDESEQCGIRGQTHAESVANAAYIVAAANAAPALLARCDELAEVLSSLVDHCRRMGFDTREEEPLLQAAEAAIATQESDK